MVGYRGALGLVSRWLEEAVGLLVEEPKPTCGYGAKWLPLLPCRQQQQCFNVED